MVPLEPWMKPPQRAVGVKRAEKVRGTQRAQPTILHGRPQTTNLTDECWGVSESGSWSVRAGEECALYRPLLVCLTFTAGKGTTPLEIWLALQGLPIA